MPLPAEGIALLCNCSMISSKGVVKFFILYKVFNCSIVLLFNDWLQGREKFVMVYKGFSIVLLSAPRFKKEHFGEEKSGQS